MDNQANKTQLSSKAYLCDKDRFMQNNGIEGQLNYNGQTISFSPEAGGNQTTIDLKNIAVADLTNIMAKTQLKIKLKDSTEFIFNFTPPLTLFRSSRLLRPVQMYASGSTAQAWKKMLVENLPESAVKQRNELNLTHVLVASLILVCILLGTLAIFIWVTPHN